MAWLLLKDDHPPNLKVSVPMDFPHRSEFEQGNNLQYPYMNALRKPLPTPLEILPPRFRISTAFWPTQPDPGPITPEMAGDFLGGGIKGTLIVSDRARYLLWRHAQHEIVFHEVEVEVAERNKPPLPGRWYAIDFLQQANPILEDRSNLHAVLSPGSSDVVDPKLYCRAVDVAGMGFWCGARSTPSFGGQVLPDRIAGPLLTYCSDSVYRALTKAEMLKGWRAVQIHELMDELDVVAEGSPMDLRRSHQKMATVWRVKPVLFTSTKWTGEFKEAREPDGRECYQFFFDDDLPALPIFEFGGLIFASPAVREALGDSDLFSEARLYADSEMSLLRNDTDGYGVLTKPATQMKQIPGLSVTSRDKSFPYLEKTNFGRINFRERLAYDAAPLKGLRAWESAQRDLYVDDATVNVLLQRELINSNNTTLVPVDLYEPR